MELCHRGKQGNGVLTRRKSWDKGQFKMGDNTAHCMLMGEMNNSEKKGHLRQKVLKEGRDHPEGAGLGSEHRGSTITGGKVGGHACSERHECVVESGPGHLLQTSFVLLATEAARDDKGAPGNFIAVIHG